MFYKIVISILGPIVRLLFRIEVRHKERMVTEGGVLICANHLSNWDPVIIACIYPRPLHFIAKQELFDVPVLGFLISRLNAFPVKRGSHDLSAIKTSMQVVKKGCPLMIFPEGTRNKTDDPNMKAKAGVAMIAAKTDAKIQPMAISQKAALFKKNVIVVGEPIYYSREEYGRLEYDQYKELSGGIMAYIRSIRET